MHEQSESELPSPIVEAPDKKSNRKTLTEKMESLEESITISSKDQDSFLKNLQQIEQKNVDKLTQSIEIQRQLTPIDKKFDILTDPLRNDQNNQSTEAQMTLSGKNNLNIKKNQLNSQPQIVQMQESVFLDEDIVRSSLILARYKMNSNKSSLEKVDTLLEKNENLAKNQVRDSKPSPIEASVRSSIKKMKDNRDWSPVQIPHDIFEDDDLLTEVNSENPARLNQPTNNQIRVNLVERSKGQQGNSNILASVHQALHQNFQMLNTRHLPNQNLQSDQNNFFLPNSNHMNPAINMPQMHTYQSVHQNLINSHQPQNFASQMQYSHVENYLPHPQNFHPSPHSEAFHNQYHNRYPSHPFYTEFDIMNEVRELRREIRFLKEFWHEERLEKNHHRYNSEFSRDRKISEDLGKNPVDSADVQFMLDRQQNIYENRIKLMEQKFGQKINKLQKEQRSLRKQNQILRKKSLFKQTGSFDLNHIDEVPRTFRQSQKKRSSIDLLANSKFDQTEQILKEKLTITKKEASVKKIKQKKEDSRGKLNKAVKKNKRTP